MFSNFYRAMYFALLATLFKHVSSVFMFLVVVLSAAPLVIHTYLKNHKYCEESDILSITASFQEFSLSHKCACSNMCLINPTKKPKTTVTPGKRDHLPIISLHFTRFLRCPTEI